MMCIGLGSWVLFIVVDRILMKWLICFYLCVIVGMRVSLLFMRWVRFRVD